VCVVGGWQVTFSLMVVAQQSSGEQIPPPAPTNKCMDCLGLTKFDSIFTSACSLVPSPHDSTPNIPWISVGSGIGSAEKWLEETTKNTIYCVDPLTDNFNKNLGPVVKPPVAKNMEEFIKTDAYKGHGVHPMMIIWSTPDNAAPYDIQAINLARPPIVLLALDSSGGAGSSSMLHWLKTLDGADSHFNTKDNAEDYRKSDFGFWIHEKGCDIPFSEEYNVSYSLVCKYFSRNFSKFGTNFYRYIILTRKDVDVPVNHFDNFCFESRLEDKRERNTDEEPGCPTQ
jgi:hypothetical protein